MMAALSCAVCLSAGTLDDKRCGERWPAGDNTGLVIALSVASLFDVSATLQSTILEQSSQNGQ